ncbi:sporulation histidine kinase inhibitor Sda [Halobacillus rhizosphaerae]|uniref:sporulation histidine kinase inhibitor Sda n=1 Tax=Halobacillus rhizosphaerae TaxID=3064889 RepID=UPI00398B4D00
MVIIEELSNRLLLLTHKRAVELKLDDEFIELIVQEIDRRNCGQNHSLEKAE